MKLLSVAASTGTLPLQAPGRTSGEGNRRVKQTGCAPVRVFLGLQPLEARRGPNKLAVSSPGQTQTIEGESKTISKAPVGELVSGVAAAASQSFLLLLGPRLSSSSFPCRLGFCTSSRLHILSSFSHRTRHHFNPLFTTTTTARAVSASAISTDNGYGDLGGSGGGAGGGSRGGRGDNKGGGGEEEDSGIQKKIKMEMFILQFLTLGYAALVGVGAAMGGTEKSVYGGGVSILVLHYVFRNLPTNPVLACWIGLTVSAAVGLATLSRLYPWKPENVFPTVEGAIGGGTSKSLMAAGVAQFVLECVFSELPTNPYLASWIGLMVSVAALMVMSDCLHKSKNVFLTGVAVVASLIMDRGYLHGIELGW